MIMIIDIENMIIDIKMKPNKKRAKDRKIQNEIRSGERGVSKKNIHG